MLESRQKNTDKICTLGPLACTFLSVQNFVRVQNGSKIFSDFCQQFNQNSGLLQSIAFDVYTFIGISYYIDKSKKPFG